MLRRCLARPEAHQNRTRTVKNPETIYLDNNATTPCAPEVVAAMLPYLTEQYGNASSPHRMGRAAMLAVERAREQVADLVGCDADEVVFTSGATESNNLALLGLAADTRSRRKVVASAIEHKSVLEPLAWLANRGFEVALLPVTRGGVVDLAIARETIDDETLLVSVQAANNEIGTLQPVRELAEIAHAHGAAVHCDASQALGKIPFSVEEIGADLASFSTHKAYGPKGTGFLVVRKTPHGRHLQPILAGGGQEKGMRPGTVNVPGIVGTGEACRLSTSRLSCDRRRILRLRDKLESGLQQKVPSLGVVGAEAVRLPGTTSLMLPNIPGDVLLSNVPQICMSTGSACSAGSLAPSHVMLALGHSRHQARCTIRISIGRYNREEEILRAIDLIAEAAQRLSYERGSNGFGDQ